MKGTGAKRNVCRGSCVSTGAKFPVAPVESASMDSGIYKNEGTPTWNFFRNSGLRKFRQGTLIVERAIKLARERWRRSERDKLDRCLSTELIIIFRAPTLDHCSLSLRLSSSVYSTI